MGMRAVWHNFTHLFVCVLRHRSVGGPLSDAQTSSIFQVKPCLEKIRPCPLPLHARRGGDPLTVCRLTLPSMAPPAV